MVFKLHSLPIAKWCKLDLSLLIFSYSFLAYNTKASGQQRRKLFLIRGLGLLNVLREAQMCGRSPNWLGGSRACPPPHWKIFEKLMLWDQFWCNSMTQATPPHVVQSAKSQAVLPYLILQLLFAVETKKDLMQFCAMPLWIIAGNFISHLASETHWRKFVGGAAPCIQHSGGLQPPVPPCFLRRWWVLPLCMFLTKNLTNMLAGGSVLIICHCRRVGYAIDRHICLHYNHSHYAHDAHC